MEITKKKNIAQDLAAIINPRDLSYKAAGIITWSGIILCLVLAFFVPRVVLTIARVVAIYMLIRFTIVAFFYIVALIKITVTKRWVRSNPIDAGLTAEQKARLQKVHHVVIIPNFKEPLEVLSETLQGLARQSQAQNRLIVVLAMEEAEPEARSKAAELIKRFEASFARMIATYHPAQLPGEIQGKAANQSWAARQVRSEVVEPLGLSLDDVTVSSCDADSVFHPAYFDLLTRDLVTIDHPNHVIWQSPLMFDLNIWKTPASVRLLTYFNNAVQISELANPASLAFPISTYSMSFRLLDDVEYWDPAVISEDWHMFLRCFFARNGQMRLRPIFLPTAGEPVIGETTWKTWINFYNQQVRHAWGVVDLGYILQQWQRQNKTPAWKKVARFSKILHDNLVFSLGSIMILVGTILSYWLDRNPIITFPSISIPYVIQTLNLLGGLGMVFIWLGERVRLNDFKYSWRLSVVLSEIASWIIFPALTFTLAGMPILQAHTKLLFGGNLVYERTPKGIVPRETNIS